MGDQKSLGGLKNEDKVRRCPDCKSTDIEYVNEELVCKKCGLVIE
jgi:predicted Zn-ribbon and HTH transcriptional regulator